MIEGSVVILVNSNRLYDVGIGHLCGREARLVRRLSAQEVQDHVGLKGRDAWFFNVSGEGNTYYAPDCCFKEMLIPRDPQPTLKSITRKDNDMALYAVTFLKMPSVKAQEAGESESIIKPSTEVLAQDDKCAVALVAAEHAQSIVGLKDEGAKLRVVVRAIG